MTLGEKLKNCRIEKKLSQKALGEKLGMPQQMIAQYESDKRKPKIETLKRISSALGVGIDTFLTDAELHLFEDMAKLYLNSDSEISEILISDSDNAIKRKIELKEKLLNQYRKTLESVLSDIDDLNAEADDLNASIDRISTEIEELQKRL